MASLEGGIFSLLPLLRGWKYTVFGYSAEDLSASPPKVAPGTTFSIVNDKVASGWFLGSVITTNYLHAHFILNAATKYGQNKYTIDASAYDLVTTGLTKPSEQVPWLASCAKVLTEDRQTNSSTSIAVALPGYLVPDDKKVTIEALKTNVGTVYIAPSSALASSGNQRHAMAPGEGIEIQDMQATNSMFVGVDNANDGVRFYFEGLDVLNLNANAAYTIAYSPAFPLPFKDGIQVAISSYTNLPKTLGGAPNTVSFNVIEYGVVYIEITNTREFYESIARLNTDMDILEDGFKKLLLTPRR